MEQINTVSGLGISVKVKIPREIRAAAKDLPEMTRVGEKLTDVWAESNATLQVVAIMAAGGFAFWLLFRRK